MINEKIRSGIVQLLPPDWSINRFLYSCQVPMNQEFIRNKPFVTDFHTFCDGHGTLVVIVGEDNQIFGGYTEIMWTNAGSVPKKSENSNSFIFM